MTATAKTTTSLTVSLVYLLTVAAGALTLGLPALNAQGALRPLPVEALVNLNTFSGRGLGSFSPTAAGSSTRSAKARSGGVEESRSSR